MTGEGGVKKSKNGHDIIYGQLDTIFGFIVGPLSILKELNIEYITIYYLYVSAKLLPNEFTRHNFFLALYLAHEIEEEREEDRWEVNMYLKVFF